jgi:hypothetical protein
LGVAQAKEVDTLAAMEVEGQEPYGRQQEAFGTRLLQRPGGTPQSDRSHRREPSGHHGSRFRILQALGSSSSSLPEQSGDIEEAGDEEEDSNSLGGSPRHRAGSGGPLLMSPTTSEGSPAHRGQLSRTMDELEAQDNEKALKVIDRVRSKLYGQEYSAASQAPEGQNQVGGHLGCFPPLGLPCLSLFAVSHGLVGLGLELLSAGRHVERVPS